MLAFHHAARSARRRHTDDSSSPDFADAVDAACRFDPRSFKSPKERTGATVVVAVQHNGFGNMLFHHAFGWLWAADAGAPFAAQMIAPREGPRELKLPPCAAAS